MTWRISKTFEFAAAHHLPQLTSGHKCRRPHGHNYTVTLVLGSDELDACGMVTDYGELGAVADWIKDELDHRDLNDRIACPTAEVLAAHVFSYWRDKYPLTEVIVCETPRTSASYTP